MRNGLWPKGLVVGIICLFVGTGVIPSTVGIIKEKNVLMNLSSRGYIQGLIDNASDGDTIYIQSGTYYENNIIINKSITLIGEDKNTTIIDGFGSTIISIVSDGVDISRFTIRNGYSWMLPGIGISSSFCTISDNIITSNYFGISLYDYSHRNNIINNIFTHNDDGAHLYDYSDQNNIINNIFMNNSLGIHLNGYNNTISDNIVTNNSDGIYLWDSNSNTISGNTINNNVISLRHSDYNIIINNTITNEDNKEYGIYLQSSSCNNIILNNSFFNTCLGMSYDNTCNNIVANNTVNGKPLVYVYDESNLIIDVDAGQIILVNCDTITVQNQEIFNIAIGILILECNNCIISSNTIAGNYNGIWLYGWDNTLSDNFITNNNEGIMLYDHSDSNNIINNNISNNYRGITFSDCNNNSIISGNTFINNWGCIVLYWGSDQNNILNNIFTNNSWCISIYHSNHNNVTSNIITNNQGGIGVVGQRNTISGNTLTNNHPYSIDLTEGANNNTISDNTITKGWDGITIDEFCTNNIISGNVIKNNFWGIGLYILNSHNTIINNTILNNSIGINLNPGGGNNHNNITNNIIRYNECGAWLYDASYNNIFTNAISNNNDGICVNYSHNNNIFNNTLRNNSMYGICLKGPDVQNNNLYFNNFIDNGQNGYDDGMNTWYHTVLHEGNYWSDYTGEDINGDGIGDTPYDIPGGNNQDLYPFMEPISWLNEPPFAQFSYSINMVSVIFNASSSYDLDGNITTWSWDFGDGNYGAGEIVIHNYLSSGTYKVTLTVIDDDGGKDSIMKEITVEKPESQKAFIFGKLTNFSSQGDYITFEAVKTCVITIRPFSFHKYVSGEMCIISKDYLGLIGVRYIFALCKIMI
jgi:parallel beta-helix repeat protein